MIWKDKQWKLLWNEFSVFFSFFFEHIRMHCLMVMWIFNEIFFCLIQASTYSSKSSIGVVCGLWRESNGIECRHILCLRHRQMLKEFEKNNSFWKWTECARYFYIINNSQWIMSNFTFTPKIITIAQSLQALIYQIISFII